MWHIAPLTLSPLFRYGLFKDHFFYIYIFTTIGFHWWSFSFHKSIIFSKVIL